MLRRWSMPLCVVVVVVLHGVTLACPMCKDSLANGDFSGAGKLPNGFDSSILFMLAGFLSVVGLVVGVIWKGIKGTL